MPHVVDSCLLTKLAGGLSKLHSADDDSVAWLTNHGGPWWRMHTTTTTMGVVIYGHVTVFNFCRSPCCSASRAGLSATANPCFPGRVSAASSFSALTQLAVRPGRTSTLEKKLLRHLLQRQHSFGTTGRRKNREDSQRTTKLSPGKTRHRASTSMYSLTCRVRFMLP